MKIFNINFLKTNKQIVNEKKHKEIYDRYDEIGKLVKNARIKKNLSIKELSEISKNLVMRYCVSFAGYSE